jgi:hypothetical protein
LFRYLDSGAGDKFTVTIRIAIRRSTLKSEQSQASAPEPHVVDAREHRCPMPLLLAKRALNGLAVG